MKLHEALAVSVDPSRWRSWFKEKGSRPGSSVFTEHICLLQYQRTFKIDMGCKRNDVWNLHCFFCVLPLRRSWWVPLRCIPWSLPWASRTRRCRWEGLLCRLSLTYTDSLCFRQDRSRLVSPHTVYWPHSHSEWRSPGRETHRNTNKGWSLVSQRGYGNILGILPVAVKVIILLLADCAFYLCWCAKIKQDVVWIVNIWWLQETGWTPASFYKVFCGSRKAF